MRPNGMISTNSYVTQTNGKGCKYTASYDYPVKVDGKIVKIFTSIREVMDYTGLTYSKINNDMNYQGYCDRDGYNITKVAI